MTTARDNGSAPWKTTRMPFKIADRIKRFGVGPTTTNSTCRHGGVEADHIEIDILPTTAHLHSH
eukprot:2826310-Karenia_brevis.AAC.1